MAMSCCRFDGHQAQGAYVARVGGDEFIGITDEIPLPAGAEMLATRMRAQFERPIEVDGHALEIDLCVGVALYPRDADNAVSLLADAALYRAKHEGRGAIRLFTTAMDQQLRERRALEHDLRVAVERGELFPEYQPQQHRDGTLKGYEALVALAPSGSRRHSARRVYSCRRAERLDRADRRLGVDGSVPGSGIMAPAP